MSSLNLVSTTAKAQRFFIWDYYNVFKILHSEVGFHFDHFVKCHCRISAFRIEISSRRSLNYV